MSDISSGVVEPLVIRRNGQGNDENRCHIEYDNPSKRLFESGRDAYAGVLGFRACHSHHLNISVRKSSRYHSRPEAKEVAAKSRQNIFLEKWIRVLPVSKSKALLPGESSQVYNNPANYKADDKGNL